MLMWSPVNAGLAGLKIDTVGKWWISVLKKKNNIYHFLFLIWSFRAVMRNWVSPRPNDVLASLHSVTVNLQAEASQFPSVGLVLIKFKNRNFNYIFLFQQSVLHRVEITLIVWSQLRCRLYFYTHTINLLVCLFIFVNKMEIKLMKKRIIYIGT